MKLSVIILNYNVRHFLELCLKSVELAVDGISAEIIVVDNASSDDSCQMVKTLFPKVKLIENTENIGFSKGNNIGVKQAKGEYICILNPDTVVAENTFKILLNFSENQRNLGIVGCKLIDGQGSFLPESKRHIPSPWVSTKKMLGSTSSYYVPEVAENEIGRVEILVGAFMLLKREVYNEVKGFDEDYFMYGEDVDLSFKVLNRGYRNYYNGNTAVIHFKGESTLKDKTYVRRFYGAMQIFYKKHFKANILFNLIVWVWVRLANVFMVHDHHVKKLAENYILISDKKYSGLENRLNSKIDYAIKIINYHNATEYILDQSYLSYESIIDLIDRKPENCRTTFKILPKNSNFILGSDDSKRQGSVIGF